MQRHELVVEVAIHAAASGINASQAIARGEELAIALEAEGIAPWNYLSNKPQFKKRNERKGNRL